MFDALLAFLVFPAELMVFKLVMAAAKAERRLPEVVAGVTSKDGTDVVDVSSDRAA